MPNRRDFNSTLLSAYAAPISLLNFGFSNRFVESAASILGDETTQQKVRPPAAISKNAMIVATTGPVAIREGLEILEQNGTAADAVLATALSQIVLAAGSWISYAGRMTAVYFKKKTGRVSALNANYNAPLEENDPLTIPRQGTPSGRTALVPGFFGGVQAMHRRFGSVSFSRLFEKAIDLAENGFTLSRGMERLIAGKAKVLSRMEHPRGIFTKKNGELYGEGDSFRQTELAKTLHRVAKEGTDYFYKGEWAKHFVKTIQAEGGKITLADMKRYQATWEKPLATNYRDFIAYTLPTPNSGGPLALAALNLASHAELSRSGHFTKSVDALKKMLQIEQAFRMVASTSGRKRLGQHLRQGELSLNDFAKADVGKHLWELVSSNEWTRVMNPHAKVPKPTPHSDAVVAIDKQGNVAAILHTINTGGWGTSGIFVDGISIPDSASHQQYGVKQAGPGGRVADHGPPMIVLKEGKPVVASSATGSGNFIATWQNLIDILEYDMTPQEAAETPNFYNATFQAGGLSQELIDKAKKDGLHLKTVPQLGGNIIGYWAGLKFEQKTGLIHGGKIRRLNGLAMGF